MLRGWQRASRRCSSARGDRRDGAGDALNTNDAARFLAIDILVLSSAVFVLLGVEARRIGITAGWFVFYRVGSLLIGVSTFAPLFLAHRQRKLDATQAALG